MYTLECKKIRYKFKGKYLHLELEPGVLLLRMRSESAETDVDRRTFFEEHLALAVDVDLYRRDHAKVEHLETEPRFDNREVVDLDSRSPKFRQLDSMSLFRVTRSKAEPVALVVPFVDNTGVHPDCALPELAFDLSKLLVEACCSVGSWTAFLAPNSQTYFRKPVEHLPVHCPQFSPSSQKSSLWIPSTIEPIFGEHRSVFLLLLVHPDCLRSNNDRATRHK
jgi:hypothetical protein